MDKFAEYQAACARTMDKSLELDKALVAYAIGLVGEAGELANLIKKHTFHGHPFDPSKMREELGDVLWHVMALCEVIGAYSGDVALQNVNKLEARYPNGFDRERSINR